MNSITFFNWIDISAGSFYHLTWGGFDSLYCKNLLCHVTCSFGLNLVIFTCFSNLWCLLDCSLSDGIVILFSVSMLALVLRTSLNSSLNYYSRICSSPLQTYVYLQYILLALQKFTNWHIIGEKCQLFDTERKACFWFSLAFLLMNGYEWIK